MKTPRPAAALLLLCLIAAAAATATAVTPCFDSCYLRCREEEKNGAIFCGVGCLKRCIDEERAAIRGQSHLGFPHLGTF